ncbi:MAG: hypothetical protein O2999_11420 [Nitrospirae bacterium]|nr:hypothetical protein [Nitrospirota bacterium]MDA1304889.1 hypothetical protein [Nitrospirota bacterium]
MVILYPHSRSCGCGVVDEVFQQLHAGIGNLHLMIEFVNHHYSNQGL